MLELAFAAWAPSAALSGSFGHNLDSKRVSEKLGYRQTGTRTIERRGEPVEHYDYRLERADWTCPVAVELEGVAPVLPLFGAVTRPS